MPKDLTSDNRQRNLNQIEGWKKITETAKFYDLHLYKFAHENGVFMIIFKIVIAMQYLSMIYLEISDNLQTSQYHKSVLSSMIPYISMAIVVDLYRETILIVASFTLAVKVILFKFYYMRSMESNLLRTQSRINLQILFALNFLDTTIFKIPIIHLATKSIFLGKIENAYHVFQVLLAIMSLAILYAHFFMDSLYGFDFNFNKRSFWFMRSNFYKLFSLVTMTVLGFMRNFDKEPSQAMKALSNTVAAVYGIITLIDYYRHLHFIKNSVSSLTHLITTIFFAFEALFALMVSLWPAFVNFIDLDYIFVILTLILTGVMQVFYQRKIRHIMTKFAYSINGSTQADQYMEILTDSFSKMRKPQPKLSVVSMLTCHLKHCQNSRCLCSIIKYRYGGNLNTKTVSKVIENEGKDRIWIKVALYDDERAIKEIKNEHSSSFHPKNRQEAINLSCLNMKQIFANFYQLMANQVLDDPFRLYSSYFSYLIYETGNCVGALVSMYNYIFSLTYRKYQNLYRHRILKNYIELTSETLHQKFLESEMQISKETLYKTYNYFNGVNKISGLMDRLIKTKYLFFKEFSESKINFKILTNRGKLVMDLRKEIEGGFEELFQESQDNSHLIRLYIEYQRKIHFKDLNAIREYTDRLRYLNKRDKVSDTIVEKLTNKTKINLYSSNNKVVFVNINKSNFTISKFSKNVPEFFGYEEKEIEGMRLNNLMPNQISRYHNSYVRDFLNRRTGSRLRSPHLVTFGMTKVRELKVIGLIIKLEFFMVDDIYLCGLINSHKRNNQRLILSQNDGTVVLANKRAYKIVGGKIFKESHSLFLSMPNLLKHYYPDVTANAKVNQISGKKEMEFSNKKNARLFKQISGNRMKKSSIQHLYNYCVDSDEFHCFLFRVFLKEKMSAGSNNGEKDKDKNGLWKFLRSNKRKFSYSSIYPKHMSILSKVIAKNRTLFNKNLNNVLKVQSTLETFKYKNGLEFKLLALSNVSSVAAKTTKFFEIACKNFKGEMADVFLVSPPDINSLYRLLKIERQLINLSTQVSIMSSEEETKGQDFKTHTSGSLGYQSRSSGIKNVLNVISNTKLLCYVNDICDIKVDDEKPIRNNQEQLGRYDFGKTITTKMSLKRKLNRMAGQTVSISKKDSIIAQTPIEKKNSSYLNGVEMGKLDRRNESGVRSESFRKVPLANNTLELKDSNDDIIIPLMKKKKNHTTQLPKIKVDKPMTKFSPLSVNQKVDASDRSLHVKLKGPRRLNTPVPNSDDDVKCQGQGEISKKRQPLNPKVTQKTTLTIKAPQSEQMNTLKPSSANKFKTKSKAMMVAKKFGDKFFMVEKKFNDLITQHSSLIQNTKVMEVMEMIKKVVKVEDLKALEESHSDDIDLSSDNISSRLENRIKKLNKIQQKKKKRAIKGNINGDSNIQYKLIRQGMEAKLGDIGHRNMQIMKLSTIIVLLVLSVLVRIRVNMLIGMYLDNLEEGKISQQITTPIVFYHKEMMKLKLVRNGNLRFEDMFDSKLFDITFIRGMKDEIMKQSRAIRNWKGATLAKKGLSLATKFQLEFFTDLNFMTLYNNIAFDYQNLVKGYNADTGDFDDSIYFSIDSGIENSFQLMKTLVLARDTLYDNYVSLVEEYNRYYLVFVLSNVVLISVIGVLLVLIRNGFSDEIRMVSSLLLKIEKKYLIAFKIKCEVQSTIVEVEEKKKNGILTKKSLKKSGIRSLEANKIFEKTASNADFLANLKPDSFDEKYSKLLERKSNSSKSYTSFINVPTSSKGLVFFMAVLAIGLVSLPILVDGIIQLNQIPKIKMLNSASNHASFLSTDMPAFYSVFYSRVLSVYKGGEVYLKNDLSILDTIIQKVQVRADLQSEISSDTHLNHIQDQNYCDYLQLSQDYKDLCYRSTSGKINYDVFLGLSDLYNYYETSTSLVESNSAPLLLSNDNFRDKDLAIYFVAEAMKTINDDVIEHVLEIKDLNIKLSFIFFISFPIFLLAYYFVYKLFWIKRNMVIIKKLKATFLALPPRIITGNSYIKNYFSMRQNGNFY